MEQKTIYINQPVDTDTTPKTTKIPKEDWGVHETHCCLKHGCKYGYNDCPVELGLIKQRYACEFGDDPDDTGCFNPHLNLVETKAYVFTKEELITFLREVQERVKRNTSITHTPGKTWEFTDIDKSSITNTFNNIINEL